ncbi:MAG TPA: HEPN domain-containing protein [Solirubrobacterales bacterium]|nr:HEPN domain-containing protein [Solirubrobacterales bacterium]
MSGRDPKAEAAVLARKAADDAKAMRLLASNQEISDEIIGFHAQQAIEKWLKAVLGPGKSSASTPTICTA